MGKQLYIYLHKHSAKADLLSYSSHIAAKTLQPARGEPGKENEMTAPKFLQDFNKIAPVMIDGSECYGVSTSALISCDIPVENRSFELCCEFGWVGGVKMGHQLIELGVPKIRLEEIVQAQRADLGPTAWA